jgi:hypothetical protein
MKSGEMLMIEVGPCHVMLMVEVGLRMTSHDSAHHVADSELIMINSINCN